MAKRKWSQLSDRQKATILVLIAIQAILATLAQRDVSSRSASEVRGPRPSGGWPR